MDSDTKLTPTQRAATIVALSASGMTQRDIATKLGISRSTVVRDLEDLKPAQEQAASILTQLVSAIDDLHTIQDSAMNYADLAKSAKNEAVRLAAENVIQDLRGVVPEKDRLRYRQIDSGGNQPMFVLPPGASLNFTFNQQNNTISSGQLPDNGATEDK